MNVTNNALNILAAKTYKGIGRAWIAKSATGDEAVAKLVARLNQSVKRETSISTYEFEAKKQSIHSQFEQSPGIVDGVMAIGDSNFPSYRGQVKNSERPVVLFYRGDLHLLDEQNQNIAVIGLLNPDEDTAIFEKRVVASLVGRGATIVSGLALGCDTIAHKQAILSGGKTVAILPSPITEILPQSNRKLAEEIVEHGGLLISEYYEKANSKMELSSRYLERNRLQALFSDCVVLSASYTENSLGNDSGSRHAMKYAQSYSIPRAIMYDPKLNEDNPKYDLNRQLFRDDHKIIVINNNNFREALEKILSRHGKSNRDSAIQTSLF